MNKLTFVIKEASTSQIDWPEFRIDTADGITVATIHGEKNQNLGRLFAAAPELLAVCKRIKQSLEDSDAVHKTSHAFELGRLDYIIAKATGEEK